MEARLARVIPTADLEPVAPANARSIMAIRTTAVMCVFHFRGPGSSDIACMLAGLPVLQLRVCREKPVKPREKWGTLIGSHQFRRDRIHQCAAVVDQDEPVSLDAREAFGGEMRGAFAGVRVEEVEGDAFLGAEA